MNKLVSTLRSGSLTLLTRSGATTRQPIEALGVYWGLRAPGLSFEQVRFAGHSKWQNIRHVKAQKDAQKGIVNSRFATLIRRAVVAGGPNPSINTKLGDLISQANRQGMPKTSIDKAIKAAENQKIVEGKVELMGPGGFLLLVDFETEDMGKFRHFLKTVCRKHKGGILKDGAAKHAFSERGVIKISKKDKDGKDVSFERAEEIAIEAGAEEVQDSDEEAAVPVSVPVAVAASAEAVEATPPSWLLLTDPQDIYTVKGTLEKTMPSIVIIDHEVIYQPVNMIELPDAELEKAAAFCEVLQETPEVSRIYDNIQ